MMKFTHNQSFKTTRTTQISRCFFVLSLLFSVHSFYGQDTDGDGIANAIDLDDDNDGILDVVESSCGVTGGHQPGVTWDSNKNTNNGNTGNPKVDRYELNQINSAAFETSGGNSMVVGPGFVDESLAAGNTTSDKGYYFVSGADGVDIAAAHTNGDYIEFPFSTLAGVNTVIRTLFFFDVSPEVTGVYGARGTNLGDTAGLPIYADYKYQVEVSADNFTTRVVLLSKTTNRKTDGSTFDGTNGQASGEFFSLQNASAFPLYENTNYKIRIYIYDSEDVSGNGYVTLDNFSFRTQECVFYDFDRDGLPNSLDLDSDGDGVSDLIESGNALATDTDNDGRVDTGGVVSVGANGIPNEVDGNDDSFKTTVTAPINSAGTDEADFLDIDSDDDGIQDNIESQATVGYIAPVGSDADGDGLDDAYDAINNTSGVPGTGTAIVPVNTDATLPNSDLIPDYLDTDSDGDGENDILEAYDTNGDGTADLVPVNADADGDGLDDAFDSVDLLTTVNPETNGTNGGELPTKFADTDVPGGEPNWREITIDTDGDGIPDAIDIDDDNDGILDTVEDPNIDGDNDPNTGSPSDIDFDGDGIPNHLDIDSDNDGIPDNVEAQATVGYVAPIEDDLSTPLVNEADTDGNGLNDAYEGSGGAGLTPENTDSDSAADYLDTDSDDDGLLDSEEAGFSTSPSGVDTDGDGLDDAFEGGSPNDGFDTNDNLNNGASGTPNTDTSDPTQTDTNVDFRDPFEPLDSDNDGIPDATDLDDDNDGILDIVENGCPTDASTKKQLVVYDNASGMIAATTVDNDFFTPGSVADQRFGGGVSYTNDANNMSGGYIDIQGVDQVDLNGAKLDGDYVEYNFQTGINPYTISQLFFYAEPIGVPAADFRSGYQYQVEISGDNFTTSVVLFDEKTVGASSYRFPATNNIPLSVKTFYRIRIYLYNNPAVNGGSITIDNVAFQGSLCSDTDSDGDGISNSLDLDSDGDGCPDALEGSGTFTNDKLVSSGLSGGNTGAGFTGSGSPVTENLGNNVDTDSTSPTYGVPIVNPATTAVVQGVGESLNASNSVACNTPPVMNTDAKNGPEDTPVNLPTITSNDTDTEGSVDPSTIILIDPNNASNTGSTGTPLVIAGVGSYTVDALGNVVFTPVLNFAGDADINYTAEDNNGLITTTPGLLDITITEVNDAPVATPNAITGTEDNPVTLPLVGGDDTDVDGNVEPSTIVLIDPNNASNTGSTGTPLVIPGVGSYTVDALGNVVFTPELNYVGDADINYTIEDNNGLVSNEALLDITITGTNDAPVATPNAITGTEDNPVTLPLVGGDDTDVDGNVEPSTIVLIDPNNASNTGSTGTPLVIPGVGSYTVDALGNVVFTPELNYVGDADINYTIEDNDGLVSNQALLDITITGVNDVPAVDSNTITVAEDANSPLGLDAPTDADGDTLTITVSGLPSLGVVTKADGTVVNNGDVLTAAELEGLVYDAPADYDGTTDPGDFTYTVSDGIAPAVTGSTDIAITGVNNTPAVDSTTITVAEDANSPLGLDAPTDADGDTLIITVSGLPSLGVVTKADGTVVNNGDVLTAAELEGLVYDAPADYDGTTDPGDFTYSVSDGIAPAVTGSTDIAITGVNNTPAVDSNTITVVKDTNSPLGLDAPTDADGDTLTITVSGLPSLGVVTKADGTVVNNGDVLTAAELEGLVYDAPADYDGTTDPGDFTYSVSDGIAPAVTGSTDITIRGTNEIPEADSTTVTAGEDAEMPLGLAAPTDADGDTLTITVTGLPILGVVTKADGTVVNNGDVLTAAELEGLVYVSPADYDGTTDPGDFAYSVSDGIAPAVSKSIDITITKVKDCGIVYNEFSPNGDGVNDVFYIECIEKYPNNSLEVFNRWGNTVYKKKGYDNTFDGFSNGSMIIDGKRELPVGTYYYVIDFGNGTNPKAGWLYLNR